MSAWQWLGVALVAAPFIAVIGWGIVEDAFATLVALGFTVATYAVVMLGVALASGAIR